MLYTVLFLLENTVWNTNFSLNPIFSPGSEKTLSHTVLFWHENTMQNIISGFG